jgi:biotin-(acetyl-CoA carboxylase) ligase/methylase of polypeptide subunit release factors
VPDPINRELQLQGKEAAIQEWQVNENKVFSLVVPATVYPPREDTELLFSCIQQIDDFSGLKLLEIGCGSGAISIAAAERGWQVTSCDINPLAVAATKGNASRNKVNLTAFEGGLDESANFINQKQIESKGPFDVIAWNLPYLSPVNEGGMRLGPLEDAGLVDTESNHGWGVALLEYLTQNSGVLRTGGAVYLLHTNNQRGNLLQSRWRCAGWATRIAGEFQFDDGERLTCFSAWKPHLGAVKEHHEELDSTNRYLLKNDFPVGSLVTAGRQTSGRGQRERSWLTRDGDFAGSWVLNANLIEAGAGIIQLDAGIAVIDAICAYNEIPLASLHWTNCNPLADHNLSIHWPNDVWAAGSKLAGCLMQGRQTGDEQKVVLGIGVNLGLASPQHQDTTNSGHRVSESSEHFPLIGLADIDSKIELEQFSKLLNAAVSSHFETGQLIPKRQQHTKVIWALMANHLRDGITLTQDGKNLTVTSLSPHGELVCHDGKNSQVVADSYNLKWS